MLRQRMCHWFKPKHIYLILCAQYVSGLTFIRYAHIQKIRNQKSLGGSKFKAPTQDS